MFKKPNSGKKPASLSQFGLLDVNIDDEDEPMDLSDDDIDLEAELAAISNHDPKRNRPRKPAPVPSANLDAMIAESLKDVPSNDEDSDDEEDPDLLNELHELAIDESESPPPAPRVSRPAPAPPGSAQSSTISLLQDRITNYTVAEKNAKDSGESSRARRFGRGIKTLNDLLKQAKAGRPVSDEDIPPPVSVGKPSTPQAAPEPVSHPEPVPSIPEPIQRVSKPLPSPPEPLPRVSRPLPSAPDSDDDHFSLPEPTSPPPILPSDSETAFVNPEKQRGLELILRRIEQFKLAALSSKRSGNKALALEFMKVVKQFDLVVDAYKAGQEMDLNELPTPQMIEEAFRSQPKEEAAIQKSAEPAPQPAEESGGLITGATLDEALRLRLAAFQQIEAKAKEEGNASKARRIGRVVKQYQDAVRLVASGRPLPDGELPPPPGHGPLPGVSPAARPAPAAPSPAPSALPTPVPTPTTTRHDKQLALLLHRQKQFKEAAIKAKKAGDIEEAKEYLRAAKGFDHVIEAARGGLVVDLKSLPLPPKAKTQLENTFDIVTAEDCGPSNDETTISAGEADVLGRLHSQLSTQLKLCQANRDHNKAMGHIAEANRFEHLAITVQQDLDVVAVAKRKRQDPPKFHYESRQFSVVQCNTDLNENDLELSIIRGIAYNVPNPREVDTYVKFEFPYPQDTPVSDRTVLVKDTNSPEYNAVFTLPIHRTARPCLRTFKRHGIKLEVCSKGGWFKSDAVLGSVVVRLAPLQTVTTVHEAFPLMDGRRPAGGSLEVKLRVRTPLLEQQVEQSTHRWLVIDN